MKRVFLISLLTVVFLCSACGKPAEQGEMTRVVFARGHGSTWGNQFRMEVCPSEVSYLHYFRVGENEREFRELYALPIEETQWEQVQKAAMELLPLLQEQKSPSLWARLEKAFGPIEVDGGKWWSLTLTWLVDGKEKDVQYVWTVCPETEAFEVLLEEMARSLDR